MKKLQPTIVCISFLTLGACAAPPSTQLLAGDDAVTRVSNCVCYASVEGQQLKPWEFAWGDSNKLRKQMSRCTCEVDIDVRNVQNPQRYVTPGTVIK